MTNSPESVARAFVRAINRRDVDGLTALMAPDHRFVDSMGNLCEGREEMRTAWIGYFLMFPDYSITIDETYCDGPVAVLLGTARGTYVKPIGEGLYLDSTEPKSPAANPESKGTRKNEPDNVLKPENHWEITLAIRAFVEDGLVTEWRVYADNEPVRQILKSAT
jgi:limonene-1,2-epoxide hydrolase